MAIVGSGKVSKPRVILYFHQTNGDVAKDFAGRMRISDNVDVTLVWENQFRSEADVIGGVGAIVIEEDVDNAELIKRCYGKWSPDTEIHCMTEDGQWKEDAEEAANQPTVTPVPTEASAGTESSSDDAPEPSGEFTEVEDVDGFDFRESIASGDTDGDSREN